MRETWSYGREVLLQNLTERNPVGHSHMHVISFFGVHQPYNTKNYQVIEHKICCYETENTVRDRGSKPLQSLHIVLSCCFHHLCPSPHWLYSLVALCSHLETYQQNVRFYISSSSLSCSKLSTPLDPNCFFLPPMCTAAAELNAFHLLSWFYFIMCFSLRDFFGQGNSFCFCFLILLVFASRQVGEQPFLEASMLVVRKSCNSNATGRHSRLLHPRDGSWTLVQSQCNQT